MRAHILVLLIIVGLLGAIVSATPDIRVNYDGTITIVDYNETFKVYVRVVGDERFAYYGNYTNKTTITLPEGKYEIVVEDSAGNHSYIVENKLYGKSVLDTMIAEPIPALFFILAFAIFTWRRSVVTAVFLFMFTVNMVMSYNFNPEFSFAIIMVTLLYILLLIMYGRR